MGGYINRAVDWSVQLKNETLASIGFRIENILLEGRVYSDAKLIMALVNMSKGDPLFAFDPTQAKEQIERMPWVESAEIERRWPDTLYIRLTERQPLAFLQKDKKLYLMDGKGEIINTNGLSRFQNLIVFIGEDSQQQAPAILAMLQAEPEILSRVETIKEIGGRRWDLVLKNGVTLKLPEKDSALALRQIADAQKSDQVLDKDIEHIDLRDHARMIIRTRPGTVQEYRASLKEGEPI